MNTKKAEKVDLEWNAISDHEIIDHWRSPDDSDCNETAQVSPDWYEQNGTPVDSDGEDMIYVITEFRVTPAPDASLDFESPASGEASSPCQAGNSPKSGNGPGN